MLRTGVYLITCTANGKQYVGSTARSFSCRWTEHRQQLRKGKHHSTQLQRTWNKYGAEAFEFSIVELCTVADVILREQIWLDRLNPEFNVAKVAYSCRGVRRTKEQRQKYSAAGFKAHAEGKRNMAPLIAHNRSAEHRRQASQRMHFEQERMQCAARAVRNAQAQRFFVRGEYLSIPQIAVKYNLNKATLYDRVKIGDRDEQLIREAVCKQFSTLHRQQS